jgi:hypothetical protein
MRQETADGALRLHFLAQVNGARVRPLDFTAKLLFPSWKLKEGDRDITVMRVIVEGMKEGVGFLLKGLEERGVVYRRTCEAG